MQNFGSDCSVSIEAIPGTANTHPIHTRSSPQLMESIRVPHDAGQHTLNPEKSMFHVFISYRSESDKNVVEQLYSTILSECRTGKKIPLRQKTKFPHNFSQNELAQEKLLNLFLDKKTLANGRDWRGDGTRQDGGFIGAIMQSLVFVPLLTYHTALVDDHGSKTEVDSGSVGKMPKEPNPQSTVATEMSSTDVSRNVQYSDKGVVDNVLLELIVAKFLWLHQKAADRNQQGHTLWPCSIIYPIFGPNMKKLAGLSSRISHETNKKAFEILTNAGYSPIESEMLEDVTSSKDTPHPPHPWSVRSVVEFFLKFQGKKMASWSLSNAPSDAEISACSQAILALVEQSISSCKEMQGHREFINPLASEMRVFMNEHFLGHFIPTLHDHGVSSIRKLSQLENHSIVLLSAHLASRFSSSEVLEFCKLNDVVMKARLRNECLPLNKRLDDFFDQNASWSTALSSTCAVDLLMKKHFYLFVMVIGSVIFAVGGIYILLFPSEYSRSFPGSDKVETFTGGFASTAILCLVIAVGLGPICIGFAYLGSPKKGRYAAAYALWLPALIVHTVAYVVEEANRPICRFLSLDTTEQSIEDCVIVKAVAFGITEVYFFGRIPCNCT